MADAPGSSTNPATKLLRNNSPLGAPIQPIWIAIACAFAIVLTWAYWPTFVTVASAWLSNPDYTHGFFVIPISLWLLWLRREHAPVATMRIDWRGLSLLILAGLIRVIAGRFYVLQLDAWTIPLWVAGVVWLLFGWPLLRWALPAIAFLWFATPLPGTIEIILSTPLQRLAASLSAWVLRLIGQPALVQGTTILLADVEQPLDVERACSGLRMFYGIFALAVACVTLSRPERWKAVLVLFAAGPVAIIANVFRIVITALLMKFTSNETAQKFSHDFAGIVMIPLAVALFLLFLVLLGRVVNRMRDPRGVAWLIRWCVVGVVLAGALLLWGRHQDARALTTLLDTAKRYEADKDWSNVVKYLSLYVRSVPEDYDTFTQLARTYREHSGSYQERLRAADLLRTAWKNQPEKVDLAISAIQVALQTQDFDNALQTSAELRAKTKVKDPKTYAQATTLRADALHAYLLSDKNRGDYNWNHLKDVLDEELMLSDFDVSHAMMLADVYRNPKTNIKNDQREKGASALLDRVVTKRATEPMAWMARFSYRLSSADLAIKATAEPDLARAIELAEKQPKNSSSANVLVNAASYKVARREIAQATSLLQRAIEIAPSEPGPYLMLAELKTAARTTTSNDEAIAILGKGVVQVRKNDSIQAIMMKLRYASLLADKGDLKGAEDEVVPIEKLVPQVTGRAQGILKLTSGLVRSQILLARDGPQPAMAHLRDLLDDSDVQVVGQQIPEMFAKGYAFLGQLYSTLGLTDLALDSFRQASRIQPTNTDWQVQAAALAQQTGDLDSADREYRAFIQKGQGTGAVRAALVEVEIKRKLQLAPKDRGDWEDVKRMLVTAQQAGAPPVTVRLLAAEILASSGEREKAEQSILKLTEESPNEPAFWRSLALMRLQRADVTGALQAVEKFAAVANQPIEATSLKAGILASSGKTDEAVKELSGAVEKAQPKEMPRAAIALSQLLAQTGKADEARTTLEKAHEKDPKNLQIVDTLANTAFLMQDLKALEKYESWLKTIEGNDGTMWRAYRAQRILASAQVIDEKDFQEAVAQVDTILQKRPHWSKAHFLQGEIDLRKNRAESATAAYERAWQYGGRGILLADRLIDLLTKQGRELDVRRYVAQVRDYLTVSQGLFDRAIPYMTDDNESQEMEKMARQWVKQKPDDSESHVRLGRVLLILSNTAPVEQKQKYFEDAKSEFRRAIELSPNDVRPWAAIVMLYGESPAMRKEALSLLEELSKQAKVSELEKAFVLAQLYDLLQSSSQAQFYFNQAATLIEANPKAPGAGPVLGRVARFYLSRVSAMGERYAKQALAIDSANPDAKFVLLNVFANRNDAKSAEEGLRLLDESKTKALVDPVLEMRYRAAFLSRRGRPEDTNAAIDLLRRSASQTREDRLLLARLYEQSGQIPAALDLLQQLVRAPNANAIELAEFLRFWQQHFVATADKKKLPQFTGQAKEAYQRLSEIDNQLPEVLRWQLHELKLHKPATQAAGDPCMPIVTELLNSPSAKELKEIPTKQLLQLVLIVLLQEQREECAMQLATSPQNGASPAELAIWLCHAYVASPATKESVLVRKQAIEKLLATLGKDANVVQSIGDTSFMAGEYQQAAAAYQQVIQLKPEERMPRNNLALALVELQKTDEARQVLSVALKSKPDDPDLLDTLAVIDIMDHHADRAIPVLEKLVAENTESPVLRFHLAVAYNDTKNTSRAREAMFTATVLGIEQRLLSPRDKKNLADMKALYMTPTPATIAEQPSASVSQANN